MAALGEFDLIDRFFRRKCGDASVRLGVGDDAAIVAPTPGCDTVVTVDMMVEGRHFLPGADARNLGHKLLAVNLSDLAAMGARPRYALLAGALPDSDPAWLEAFSAGLFALAGAHQVTLIGGDTTRGPRTLCLTAIGELPAGEAVRRSGAAIGDEVWVSGELGDAMLALAALEGRTKLAADAMASARARLERPTPRVALGQRLLGIASSMLDVSDGLVGDLGHLLAASHVGARLDISRVPRSASLAGKLAGAEREAALHWLLAGGDDYELCFTASPSRGALVGVAAASAGVAVTAIGTITPEDAGFVIVDERGQRLRSLPRAFDHFA